MPIADELRKLPATAIPWAKIEPSDVLELQLNVSWFEALSYMVKHRISSVPLKQNDHYVGHVDRYTFVHWAAEYTKKTILEAEASGNAPPSPDTISAEIIKLFTTQPLTHMDKAFFHSMNLIGTNDSAFDVVQTLSRPGVYRTYLTDNGKICGIITQQGMFSWLVDQPFVREHPELQKATIGTLLKASAGGNTKTKSSYVHFDLSTPAYIAISAIKRNPTDKSLADGCVMLGEEGTLITMLRRRDLDEIACREDLTLLCATLSHVIAEARNSEVAATAGAIIVTSDALLLTVAKRLAASHFEQAFVSPIGGFMVSWASVEEVVSDGRIARYLLEQ
ncbi:hypothetical protein GMRT_13590 [Giardia muris]|uniref:CBS domain-containing protein n=1 Tax=Giardia muris TaxID=5742 RepID=A0A4Z1SWS8_GIAMU|nr:hypothetical protein GMRT_13590 [Giardia muris]|eukprot:TNJ30010.1 hypothetical protein GMRT_13590 [Giardia muris]